MLAERGSSLQPEGPAMLAEHGLQPKSGPGREAEEMTYKAACAPVVNTHREPEACLAPCLDTRVL